jgi:hypothetical protein
MPLLGRLKSTGDRRVREIDPRGPSDRYGDRRIFHSGCELLPGDPAQIPMSIIRPADE